MSVSENSPWFAVEVLCPAVAVDAVESAMDILCAEGIETDSLGRKDQTEQKVVGYFNELPPAEELGQTIRSAIESFGLPEDTSLSISTRAVENEDWLAEWKRNWKPTVTGRFIVAPAWQQVNAGERIVIRIDPSMAFGTGTHETTRLCLKAIESNYRAGESFLDVGTGTGILAIGAALLQKGNDSPEFYGCDNDEDSIRIAIENSELNKTPFIRFEHGVLQESAPVYDFTCANLTADVILPILILLVSKTRRILVLSGILAEQRDSVTEALDAMGAQNYEVEQDGEWIGIIVHLDS